MPRISGNAPLLCEMRGDRKHAPVCLGGGPETESLHRYSRWLDEVAGVFETLGHLCCGPFLPHRGKRHFALNAGE